METVMKKNILIFISVLLLFIVYACASGKIKHYQLSQFVSAETCGGCHDQIYAQWKGSMHQLALNEIIYTEVADAGLAALQIKMK